MRFYTIIIWYLKKCYHRPSAKLEALIATLHGFTLINKSRTFSERELLIKKPHVKLIFYNYLGLIFFNIRNTFSVILFSRFWDTDFYLERNSKETNEFLTRRNSFKWEYTKIDQKENISDNFIENQIIEASDAYKFAIKYEETNSNLTDSKWWIKNRLLFQENLGLNINNIPKQLELVSKFRNSQTDKAYIISDNFRLWPERRNNKINLINSLHIINQYHHLAKRINPAILTWVSDLYCGGNSCVVYKGQRLNERTLRHAYYTSQIVDIFKNLGGFFNGHKIILDIGGAYGGLLRYLKLLNRKSTCILAELPEVLYLADFYISNAFPKAKILRSNNKNLQEILSNLDEIKKFDFILISPSMIQKIPDRTVDLTINTTSFGEMSKDTQDYYANIINDKTKTIFYSVNRYGGSSLKFNECSGFSDFKLDRDWAPLLLKSTHTYHLEQALFRN